MVKYYLSVKKKGSINPIEKVNYELNGSLKDIDEFTSSCNNENELKEEIGQLYGINLDGKITAIFGTHTHVQTADEQILPKGTGFICDIGMTGPKNSVIGMDIKASIKRFETSLPEKYRIAEGKMKLNSVMFCVDDETNKVKKIVRINR